ncbi:hypothetical protein IFM89_007258 [Coptis chinensis]|uniref:GATA-type domain-containing protein n=1 Tax=Coptis chinensis TaxID=261450 RepID=A0A835M534_9MAGN|nr:hypothetical protein IFM89_007258 [Coptis chinensis]
MHRCNSTQGNNTNSSRSCDFFHTSNNSFSMVFPTPHPYDEADMYPITSSVDCTLSLGTPSTRQSNNKSSGNSFMSNLCWGSFQTKKNIPSTPPTHKTSCRGGFRDNYKGTANSLNEDLIARRCANCDTTSTPLWRNGPRGPKSLCNACGIRFKKEERRATAANNSNSGPAPTIIEPQHLMSHHHHHHAWAHHAAVAQAFGNDFRCIDGETTGVPFLSWRLNVPDRTSLVHDCTF